MPTFKTTFDVAAPLQAVADFHASTNALKLLNPPGMIVQLHRVDPMDEGSISEFTLWFGPIPIRWKAIHNDVSINGFTDRMVKGPAKTWVHNHRYEPISPSNTRVFEHIDYEHKSGLMGMFTRVLFSPLSLKILFAYRAWATKRAVQKTLASAADDRDRSETSDE